MLKQSLLVLLGSLLVVLLATEVAFVLKLVDQTHLLLTVALAKVFAGGTIGSIIRHTISLFLIPFFIALIPSLIYWAVTRKTFKYFMHILWIAWIILATILIVR
jgi:hypothetical protein